MEYELITYLPHEIHTRSLAGSTKEHQLAVARMQQEIGEDVSDWPIRIEAHVEEKNGVRVKNTYMAFYGGKNICRIDGHPTTGVVTMTLSTTLRAEIRHTSRIHRIHARMGRHAAKRACIRRANRIASLEAKYKIKNPPPQYVAPITREINKPFTTKMGREMARDVGFDPYTRKQRHVVESFVTNQAEIDAYHAACNDWKKGYDWVRRSEMPEFSTWDGTAECAKGGVKQAFDRRLKQWRGGDAGTDAGNS